VKEKPILFSDEMVRAILDSRKSQTRRVINPQPVQVGERWEWTPKGKALYHSDWLIGRKPPPTMLAGAPYQVGDHLWVREALRRGPELYPPKFHLGTGRYGITYSADLTPMDCRDGPKECMYGRAAWQWKHAYLPSRFMPKWATRIWLEVTDKRAEQVQDISEEDARAEGAEPVMKDSGGFEPMGSPCPEIPHYGEGFAMLWDGINAKRGYPFADNPWVFVYAFSHLTG